MCAGRGSDLLLLRQVLIEHDDGSRRCSAALVSLRTVLTSAQCARGAGAELWARVPAPRGAPAGSRVLRVAFAAGSALDAVK